MNTRAQGGGEEFSFTPPEEPRREPVSRRLVSIVVAVVLVAGVGGFLVLRLVGRAEAEVYRYSFTRGQTTSYEIQMDMTATPRGIPEAPASLQVRMTASMDMTVVEQRPDGTAVVEIKMRNLQVTPSQGAVPQDVGTVRVTVSPDGRITDVEGLAGLFSITGADPSSFFGLPGGGTDGASSQMFFPTYPSEGIAPGSTWSESTTFPFPFGDDEITMKVDGTHEGFEETPFGRAARIHHHIDFPMDVDFTITELFDAMIRFAQEFGEQTAPTEPPPAAFRNARIVFDGGMVMDTDSLVLPDTGEFVQMDGTGEMSFTMRFEGVPASELGGMPTDFAMDATYDLSIVRVGAAG